MKLENVLSTWFIEHRKLNVPAGGLVMKEKAK